MHAYRRTARAAGRCRPASHRLRQEPPSVEKSNTDPPSTQSSSRLGEENSDYFDEALMSDEPFQEVWCVRSDAMYFDSVLAKFFVFQH